MAKHPNCEFIVAFAEGKEVQFKCSESGNWFIVEYLYELEEHEFFRIKPKTRMINGFEVPCAMDKEPEHNQKYFIPALDVHDFYVISLYNCGWDTQNFKRGLCFSNKEDAIAAAKAMLGIDPNS